MNCEEARELITALVDNELSQLERPLIDTHLKECSRCLRVYEQEQSLKREVQNLAAHMSTPAELRKRIEHGILFKRETLFKRWKDFLSFHPVRGPALAVALLFLVLLPTIYFFTTPQSQPLALAALNLQQKIAAGELSMRKATNPNEIRDWQIRAVNSKFLPVKFDLSSIGLEPTGGLVQDINGRKVLVTVYSGSGASVTCFTFLGTENDAPGDATVFFDQNRNVNFYTFSEGEYNAVLHREGDVICLLVSTMSIQELLAMVGGQTHS
jgi:mycothiol system anti-sigma-R factor